MILSSPKIEIALHTSLEPPPLPVKHKNHIPKVMFLAAIGEPTASLEGAVGIWPVQQLQTPKRASAQHPRVNGHLVPFMKCCNLDGDTFVHMITTLYIPKIVELGSAIVGSNRSLVVWSQLDNAGGHGLGFTLDKLNEVGAKAHPKIRIHFHTQPPNSPDLNVLDLGA